MRRESDAARVPEGGGGDTAEDLVWAVIREDENGNRYRVGRYATREEAQGVCDAFAERRAYVIERVPRREAS